MRSTIFQQTARQKSALRRAISDAVGKGNAVCRMFSDIEADVHAMVDPDVEIAADAGTDGAVALARFARKRRRTTLVSWHATRTHGFGDRG
jgi:hypothetical protein